MKNNKRQKILILRLGAIGDVVLTTIIPYAIKQAYPDCEIHYLTQSENIPLLENNENIDKIFCWQRSQRKSLKYLFETGKQLRKEKYDVIFNLTNAIRNVILSTISCPKKIVFKKNSRKSWVEDYFYTAKTVFKDIELPNRLYLGVNKELNNEISTKLSEYPTPHIVLVVGGRTDKNRQGRLWNIEYWKELREKLNKTYGGTIFITGGKNERDYHNQLANDYTVVLSGDYDLGGTSALLSQADLVISGDTGPAHIATGHNVKTLALLGSTSPDKIKPYGDNGYFISAQTDCKYCWKKKCPHLKEGEKYTPCMENLLPDMVMDKIKQEKLL